VAYKDPYIGSEYATYGVVGSRNLSMMVDLENINFSEVE